MEFAAGAPLVASFVLGVRLDAVPNHRAFCYGLTTNFCLTFLRIYLKDGLSMEMHQIRYFLAVARTLHFTRAAEECNVSQPSLTRAIKNLEAELGGELFRRERASSHLTGLGRSMVPLLTNCLKSAEAAKTHATALRRGDAAVVHIALSETIDFDLIADALAELSRVFTEVKITCHRGNGEEILESLRAGDTEIAIAGPIDDNWDRLDTWPLFVETHCIVVHRNHPLVGKATVAPDDLSREHVIFRPYCEQSKECAALLAANDVNVDQCHDVERDRDVIRLLESGIGVGLLPVSVRLCETLRKIPLTNPFERTVRIYTVAGRERSQAMSTLLNLLRAADWSRFMST